MNNVEITITPNGIIKQDGKMITHAWPGGIMYYKLLAENLQNQINELKKESEGD
jgi:hypothetical protein